MKINLTPEEEKLQIWQAGDWIEVLSGTLTITGSGTIRVNPQLEQSYIKFFFDAARVGTYDVDMFFTSANLPNGPALYLRYCRNAQGTSYNYETYGLISLVNGSWCHLFPIEKSGLIPNTERFKSFYTQIVKKSMPLAGGLLGGLMVKKTAESALRRNDVLLPNFPEVEEIYSSMRRLIHRMAMSSDQYRDGGTGVNSRSGKL